MSTSGNADENTENSALPEDYREWSCSHLVRWMADNINSEPRGSFKKEEISLFKGAQISGKTLPMIDREVLRDIGITSVGRQLEILQAIQEVVQPAKSKDTCVKTGSSTHWKKKVKKIDQTKWSEANKNLYRMKLAVVRREAAKIWPGNEKVYFKQNQSNLLKLEELASKLTETCTMSDIGFGREAIRSHIIQWGNEKNRRLADGYDFEVEHTRTKRARKSSMESSPSSSSGSTEGGDTETLESGDAETEVPEHNIDKISKEASKGCSVSGI